jgi:hypothetical protein
MKLDDRDLFDLESFSQSVSVLSWLEGDESKLLA